MKVNGASFTLRRHRLAELILSSRWFGAYGFDFIGSDAERSKSFFGFWVEMLLRLGADFPPEPRAIQG